ncbi:MAG: class I SAM-dependent methyltransferase [Wenzhouxiangellaceae bacterium]
MKINLKLAMLSLLLLPLMPLQADDRLDAVVADPARPDAEKQRDPYRNPAETLAFFGIAPDMTVVEIAPGGGWYTEILGPYLAEQGKLVGAQADLESEHTPEFYHDIVAAYMDRIADTERFGDIEVVPFDPPRKTRLGEPGSADMVVTFRNAHGWERAGVFGEVLTAAHEVLKRGGVLGIVQHRLPEDADDSEYTGYVKQSKVVAMAESHGFRLVESSEINANPADTADHPQGVWTLPPSLRQVPEEEQDSYREIGESDRMTLKFVKR